MTVCRRRRNCCCPRRIRRGVRQWAGRHGLTLNTAVLFAWTVVLSRLTDRRDVVFGTIVSGRPETACPAWTPWSDCSSTPCRWCTRSSRDRVGGRAMRALAARVVGDARHRLPQSVRAAAGTWPRRPVRQHVRLRERARSRTPSARSPTPDGARFSPIEMESLTHYPLTVVSHLKGDALVVLVEAIRPGAAASSAGPDRRAIACRAASTPRHRR